MERWKPKVISRSCVALHKHRCRHLTSSIMRHWTVQQQGFIILSFLPVSSQESRFPNQERNIELHVLTPVGYACRALACIIWGRVHGITVQRCQTYFRCTFTKTLFCRLSAVPKRSWAREAGQVFPIPFLRPCVYVFSFLYLHVFCLVAGFCYALCNNYLYQSIGGPPSNPQIFRISAPWQKIFDCSDEHMA